jgi:hypothetical protein
MTSLQLMVLMKKKNSNTSLLTDFMNRISDDIVIEKRPNFESSTKIKRDVYDTSCYKESFDKKELQAWYQF